MTSKNRMILAGAYWLAVATAFILNLYGIADAVWFMILTLPWSILAVVIAFITFNLSGGHEWSSHAAVKAVDFIVFVILCGGLNAGFIVFFGKIRDRCWTTRPGRVRP